MISVPRTLHSALPPLLMGQCPRLRRISAWTPLYHHRQPWVLKVRSACSCYLLQFSPSHCFKFGCFLSTTSLESPGGQLASSSPVQARVESVSLKSRFVRTSSSGGLGEGCLINTSENYSVLNSLFDTEVKGVLWVYLKALLPGTGEGSEFQWA